MRSTRTPRSFGRSSSPTLAPMSGVHRYSTSGSPPHSRRRRPMREEDLDLNDQDAGDAGDAGGTGDQDPNAPPAYTEALELRELIYVRSGRRDELDEREPGDDKDREWLNTWGSGGEAILKAIDDHAAEERVAEERHREEEARVTREQRKTQLAAEREQAAQEAAEKAHLEELDAELSAELDQESGIPTATGPSPKDVAYATLEESLRVVHDPKATPEEKLRAADEGIEA